MTGTLPVGGHYPFWVDINVEMFTAGAVSPDGRKEIDSVGVDRFRHDGLREAIPGPPAAECQVGAWEELKAFNDDH